MAALVVLNQGAIAALFTSEQGMVGKELTRRAVQVERAAKRLAPVDTGRLRSSINHTLARDGQGLLALVGTNVNYAIHQEFGTRYMSAHPFLRPALSAGR